MSSEETEKLIDQTYELTSQQEDYPPWFYDPMDNGINSSLTAEQKLIYSSEDVYYKRTKILDGTLEI